MLYGGRWTRKVDKIPFFPSRIVLKYNRHPPFVICKLINRRSMQDLQQVKTFFLQDDELYLAIPMNSGTMRFRAVPF